MLCVGPFNAGQLEDDYCNLKRQKTRSRRLRLQKHEAFMLQSVPPYMDTLTGQKTRPWCETMALPPPPD
jgi:hypothetical protein